MRRVLDLEVFVESCRRVSVVGGARGCVILMCDIAAIQTARHQNMSVASKPHGQQQDMRENASSEIRSCIRERQTTKGND